jgi:hypothetical protein
MIAPLIARAVDGETLSCSCAQRCQNLFPGSARCGQRRNPLVSPFTEAGGAGCPRHKPSGGRRRGTWPSSDLYGHAQGEPVSRPLRGRAVASWPLLCSRHPSVTGQQAPVLCVHPEGAVPTGSPRDPKMAWGARTDSSAASPPRSGSPPRSPNRLGQDRLY